MLVTQSAIHVTSSTRSVGYSSLKVEPSSLGGYDRTVRNNVIAFSILGLILIAEYQLLLKPFVIEVLLYQPGECRGYTTYYHPDFGINSWDCAGNRRPDDKVDVPAPSTPEEATVADPEGGPR